MSEQPRIRTFTKQYTLKVSEVGGLKQLQDVSLITEGDALGHDVRIDSVTLDNVAEALKGRKLRAYVTHDGAMWGDRLTREAGIFSGIKRDGDKVKAASFKPLKAFAEHNRAQYDALFEMAEEMPGEWGISIVPEGYAVWAMEDGTERPFRYGDDKPDGAVGDKPALRVTSVMSADFVDAPAANVGGLFRADANENKKKGNTDMADNDATKEALALSKQVNDLTKQVDSLKTELKAAEIAFDEQVKQLKAEHTTQLSDERNRAKEVLELGKAHKKEDLAIAALSKGTTVNEFRAELLDSYKSGNVTQDADPESGGDQVTTLRAQLAACKDPVQKGRLAQQLNALRNKGDK